MKTIKAVVLSLILFAPFAAQASGTQIGTSPLLDMLGVVNVYGQARLNDTSAVVGSYSDINGTFSGSTLNLTGFSLAYKNYTDQYANGLYWELGAADFDVTASTSSTFNVGTLIIPIAVVGYEKTYGNLVVGGEGGIGTGGGWGLLGVNAAYQF